VTHGLDHGRPLAVRLEAFDPELRVTRATFVTLRLADELRGCIGVLAAHQALIADVAHNAYAAAFADPRFTPVTRSEFDRLDFHISLLNAAEALSFSSEADLLSQIRPGVDGLILHDGRRRATFLPAVWETIPRPQEFLRELKHKAGLASDHWSTTLKVERYTCESIS
jgi:AmmeMemoRadiSam system protein A